MIPCRRVVREALVALAILVAAAPAGAVDRSASAAVRRPSIGGQPWTGDAKARLGHDIDALLAGAPTLRGTHVGMLAIDTHSGDVLYARNADDTFVPASTFKLLTGSVALAVLGPQYRFHTEAFVDAARHQLIIRPGGDPLLAVADLRALAGTLRAAGMTTLPLGVGVDPDVFEEMPYPPGWSWDDFPYDYAPMLSAATIEENVIALMVYPGAAIGQRVRVSSAAPFASFQTPIEGCSLTREIVVVAQAITTEPGSSATLGLARTPGGCIAITGSLPLDAASQELDAAVPSPVRYLRDLATHALHEAGVGTGRFEVIAGPLSSQDGAMSVPAGAASVWTHDGEPLSDLLADMWWPSDNLVAENLLKAIGVARTGGPGTIAHGVDTERAWLTGIGVDPDTLTIADGSGLSTYDRITPRALTAILQADWNSPYRDIVLDDLPLAGVRGTLEKSFAGTLAERRTFAKTGSVSHARGLAGYLATLHHGAVTFAWSVDDWMGENDDLGALRARVLSRIIGD